MPPFFVRKRSIKPTVIKKANQFNSFKFGDIRLLDERTCLSGATSFDSSLWENKISEIKRFIPYEWYDHPDKMQKTELLTFDEVYTDFRSCNPPKAEDAV